MKTMSVTRALAELKRLDDRIQTAMHSSEFVSVTVGQSNKIRLASGSGMTVSQAESKIQSNKDSLDSMFKERTAIKSAIVKSNATTLVKLGNQELTVAEAIELKRSIEMKRQLVENIKRQLIASQNSVNLLNEKLNTEIEQNMTAIYGSDKGKVDSNAYESVAGPKKLQKEAALLDPLKAALWVENLENEISLVDTELDFTLSESNAKTEISF